MLLVASWLLLNGPHPGIWLPAFLVARTLPKVLASPYAGLLADRIDRRVLYRCSRLLAILPPALLALLILSPLASSPAIIIAAALGALVAAIDQPSRRGLLWDVGGPGRIVGAMSLSTAAFHSAAALAPALAVVLLHELGTAAALGVTVLIASLSAACAWRFTRGLPPSINTPSVTRSSPLGGIQYLLNTPRALLLLLLTGAPGLIGRGLAIIVPLVAGGSAHGSFGGAGALASAPGAGAFMAAVALSILGEVSDKSRFALLCGIAFTASLALYPMSDGFYLEIALLALSGACSAAFGSVIVSMLQLQVPDHLRCRVMAL